MATNGSPAARRWVAGRDGNAPLRGYRLTVRVYFDRKRNAPPARLRRVKRDAAKGWRELAAAFSGGAELHEGAKAREPWG
jgi:hypothetical protein